MSHKYSRRAFLQMSTAVAATFAAACQVPVAAPEGGAPAADDEKLVRILLPSWATGEIPFDTTAREFSDMHPDVRVQIETTTDGWETRVFAQINDGTLEWSGAGIASSASSGLPRWILIDLIQPMDDYIAASDEDGADEMLEDMLPVMRAASTYEEQFWGIPYSFENISFNWRTDYLAEVGLTEAPTNWDEWLEMARALKEWGEAEQIYPTSFINALDASVGTLIYGSMEEPYDPETLVLRWDSDEAVDALAFYRQLVVEEEVTPPHGFDGWLDAYYAGKVASVMAQSSRGVWGQLAFGTDAVTTSPVPVRNESNAGTPFWGNCVSIFNNAPYPQETLDYFVYTMGPQNTDFQKTVIRTGKTPVYESAYDTIIASDPQFRTYGWMENMRAQVERSVPRPFNNYFSIQDTHYQNYVVQLVEPGSTMTPEECAQLILQASLDEIAQQQL